MRNFIHFRSAGTLLGTLLGIMEEIDSSYGTFHRTEETFRSIDERAKILSNMDQISLIHHILYWVRANKKQIDRILSLLQDYVAAGEGMSNDQRDLVGFYDLAEYRKRHNLTQNQLAKKLHCTQKHISDLESGRKWPSRAFVDRFASVFNTDSIWPPYVPGWITQIDGSAKAEATDGEGGDHVDD